MVEYESAAAVCGTTGSTSSIDRFYLLVDLVRCYLVCHSLVNRSFPTTLPPSLIPLDATNP